MLNYALLYLEHLGTGDLDLIATVTDRPDRLPRRWADRPELIDELLGAPRLFEAIFGGEEMAHRVSPFLAFGVLVHRLARDLVTMKYVPEWAGPKRRIPVFDTASLGDFLAEGVRRYFLTELLSSFTKVASGSIWIRTRRGYRRRRFSELDPVRLAEMVDLLPVIHRPAGYRRLGDVALFLSGVFPDHTARHPLPAVEREHLARSAGIRPVAALREDLGFFEAAGAGWYRRAVEAAASGIGIGPEFLNDVADRFIDARRVLNLLSDRYLYRFDPGLMHPAA